MNHKPLGKTGIKISEIGQGTWAYNKKDVEPLRLGVSLGATHIDTAEIYGTEGIVGKAIQGIRDKVFLATKLWTDHFHHDDVLKACEASLKRLGVEYVDLYMLHWPNESVPIKETMGAMEELANHGKIKHIGVSNFSVEQIEETQDALSKHKIVANQVKYNLNSREIEEDLIPYCKKEKITVVGYSPLKGSAIRQKLIGELAAKYGKTRAQIILNYLTAEDYVVTIPKADNPDHVRENCGASGWRLSNEDMKLVSEKFS